LRPESARSPKAGSITAARMLGTVRSTPIRT
jgi:hypothetical protein